MDTCNNSSSAAAATAADSLLENLISGETMEGGGEDETLEWLSIYVEDCLSGATHYTPAIKLPPAPNSRLCFRSLGGPAVRPRSKRRRIGSFAALRRRRTSDTPSLLPQSSWLAESELIVLPPPSKKDKEIVKTAEREERVLPRKCSHCLSQKTPQWRAGPLGPKTLCNACGVRFRSGRLLPEYRPAKSPTFETYKHSNSHKKVMEMRMALMSSDCS